MIKVTIEMHPFGAEDSRYTIGTIFIANVGQVQDGYCQYDAWLGKDPRRHVSGKRPFRDVNVLHKREDGVNALIHKVLDASFRLDI